MERRLAWASTFVALLLAGSVAAARAEAAQPHRAFELDTATGGLTTTAPDRSMMRRSTSSWASADGTRIAFASDHDLLRDGSNLDRNLEIFLLDTAKGELLQLTSSRGGTGSVSPRVNAGGTRIVFASDRDLLGDGSNAEDEVQLFLFDVLTAGLAQLTHVEGGLVSFPGALELSLDDAGIRVAFASDRDVLGNEKNADENLEIFLLDTTTRALRQLTETTGGQGCFAPIIDGAGTRVRWTSDHALLTEKQGRRVASGKRSRE